MEEKVSLERAMQAIDELVNPLGSESVEVMMAGGRVVAERVNAWVDLPGANISVLDGFAVNSEEAAGASPEKPVRLKIAGTSILGEPYEGAIPQGCAIKVNSGAALPEGADAVAKNEEVKVEGEEVEITTTVSAGLGTRNKSEEFRVGEMVIEDGVVLNPGWISLLIAAGWAEIKTMKFPRVRVIAAGDELKTPGRTLIPGDVFPSVAGGIVAWCRMMGASEVRLNVVLDDPFDIQEELPEPSEADLVITLGGTGMSQRDVTIAALQERGVEIVFRGMTVKPGHYTAFGMFQTMPVLSLPGGPAAAEMMFQLLGRRAIYNLMGMIGRDLPMAGAQIAEAVAANPEFDQLLRVRLEDKETGLVAVPIRTKHIHRDIAQSEGIVLCPRGMTLAAGAAVDVWMTR